MRSNKAKVLLGIGAVIAIVLPIFFAPVLFIGLLFLGPNLCQPVTVPAAQIALGGGTNVAEFFGQFAGKSRQDRMENAKTIISVGKSRHLSDRDIEIAVATSIQETKLENSPGGDRDSLGLFQQRPSQGWGSPELIMQPVYASNKFFDALVKVQNRDQLSLMDAAIAVQHPDAQYYLRDWHWDSIAAELVTGKSESTSSISASAEPQPATCNAPSKKIQQAANIKGDDYPYAGAPVMTASPLGYFYRECVDFAAWRLNIQAGTTFPPFKFDGLGNAADWKDRLVAQGYRADSVPAVGSVAWWGPFVGDGSLHAGVYGHVAIVSAVNSDGSIVVEQYNVAGIADHSYNKMTLPASYLHFLMFIHVADVKGATSNDVVLAGAPLGVPASTRDSNRG